MSAERGQPFLSPDELESFAKRWKKASAAQEAGQYKYITARQEFSVGDKEWRGKFDIEHLHGVSFLQQTIPLLIERKQDQNQPVRILDVGGGEGFFAQQIRETFPDGVSVHTTGLRKKLAGERRELHKDDLKWRSVLQLTEYPEFDLVLDTYGEATYGPVNKQESEAYVHAIVSKLQPGGVVSMIVGATFHGLSEEERKKMFQEFAKKEGCLIYQRSRRIQLYKPRTNETPDDAKNAFADLLNLPDFVRGRKK